MAVFSVDLGFPGVHSFFWNLFCVKVMRSLPIPSLSCRPSFGSSRDLGRLRADLRSPEISRLYVVSPTGRLAYSFYGF